MKEKGKRLIYFSVIQIRGKITLTGSILFSNFFKKYDVKNKILKKSTRSNHLPQTAEIEWSSPFSLYLQIPT